MNSPGARVHPLAWFWIYTGMRLALLLAIFGVLWLCGLGGFVGAAVALLLTIPLSYVVLGRPRAAMVASMDRLRDQRRTRTDAFDQEVAAEPTLDIPNQPIAPVQPRTDVEPVRPRRKNRS